MSSTDSLADTDLDRLARRRAAAKMGWFIHATVYATVNLLLFLSAWLAGRQLPLKHALAWGLGLAIHAMLVFFLGGGGGLHQRLLRRERKQLSLQRDPW